jgi:hypothetical protein
MKKIDLIPAIFWMGLGIAVAVSSYRLHLGTLANPGPGLAPFFLGIILSLCSLPILVRSFLVILRNQKQKDEPIWSGIQFKKLIIVVASLLGYWIFLEKIGFVLTTFLLLLILFKTMGSQRWRSVLVASILTVLVVYTVFVVVLRVVLPAGVWRIG